METSLSPTVPLDAKPERVSRTLHRETVETLARWIVSGRWGEAVVLPNEMEIAKTLGVSRTVVREAERTLAAKGILNVRRKLGTVVQPRSNWSLYDPDVLAWRFRYGLDADFINDLFSFRGGIESFAAEICAANPNFDPAPLATSCNRMEAALNGEDDWFEADLSFHESLLTGTENQFILHLVPLLHGIFRVLLLPEILLEENMRVTLPRHRDVVEAIAARDPAAARAAMLRLIAEGRQDFLRKIVANQDASS